MSPEERAEKAAHAHRTCEDPWYSCPLSPEGCADDDAEGCYCGREAEVQRIADEIRAAVLEEREGCALAMCGWCRLLKLPVHVREMGDPAGKVYLHDCVDGEEFCGAAAIRAREGP